MAKRPAIRRILAGLILLFPPTITFASCSGIDAGTITAKEIEPAYTYTTLRCEMWGPKGLCFNWEQDKHYVAPKYRFDLADGDQTGHVYVTPPGWASYQVGDHYP